MITRLVRCRRGVVSVEAALIFPVVIMLALGTMEFALLLFTYSSMQTAVREATRQVAVNFATPAEVEADVLARLPAWTQDAATVTVTQSAPANPEVNVVSVRVSMPVGDATPVRFFSRASDWDLGTEVAMKQELPL